MIAGKKVLAVIPARGGSKGVPRKNIWVVDGKPLIAYTIEAAKQSRYLDRVVVSSEDAEILKIAADWGADVIQRPEHLARDETPGIEPVLHVIGNCPDYDYVVLLQPTSPLRAAMDIDGALEHCLRREAPVCVSICVTDTPPSRVFQQNPDSRLERLLKVDPPNRRQDLPECYVVNGAVYIAETRWLTRERKFITEETVGYEMPPERSLDIDTFLDLRFLEFMLQKDKNYPQVLAP